MLNAGKSREKPDFLAKFSAFLGTF